MQHIFIETSEATSIYKLRLGASLKCTKKKTNGVEN